MLRNGAARRGPCVRGLDVVERDLVLAKAATIDRCLARVVEAIATHHVNELRQFAAEMLERYAT